MRSSPANTSTIVPKYAPNRKFTKDGKPIYVCEEFGAGPERPPGLAGITLQGSWEVDIVDVVERGEYGIVFISSRGEGRFTIYFTQEYARDTALKLITSTKTVKDAYESKHTVANVINENSGKLAIGAGIAALGLWAYKKKKDKDAKNKSMFDESSIY